jgi:hypothetical protein
VVGETIAEEFRWREAIPSTFYCSLSVEYDPIRVFSSFFFWGMWAHVGPNCTKFETERRKTS